MSLFKKPNRKFRQRETRNDSEDESAISDASDVKYKTSDADLKPVISLLAESARPSNISATSHKEDKSDSSLPKSKLLSFHDEEDETEVFKLKKSNYSRRLAKQREKERKKREDAGNPFDAIIKHSPPDIKIVDSIKRSEKKPKESWDVLAGNDAEDMEVESDEDGEKSNPFKNVLQSGVIPDAATIYAMKKHRQMAREMGDFIPVEDPEKEDESKSRLIRDDDNDDDDDDDEPSRINFTVNTGAAERQKIRETFLSLQDDEREQLENEDAAELERWEREQIKKGVGVTQVGPLDSAQASESQLYLYQQVGLSYTTNNSHGSGHSQPIPSELLEHREISLTTDDIKARIEERLNSLKSVNRAHQQEHDQCEKALIEASELVKQLEMDAPERERNFSLYQRMSSYARDLVECMDVKAAHVDLLDGRMIDLYKLKAQKLAARRQLDIRDQSEEFSTLSSEILKGMNAEFLCEKPAITDEIKLRRAAEREGRRMRRRKQRERQSISKSIKHQDGMSSDDEEPDIDILKFNETKGTILNEVETIFEDVVEDFGTLEGVMLSFESWKSTRLTSYCEAYVPLCLPKIFGVFVKLALLGWNPLLEERDFEKTSWFRQLLQYGCDNFKENGEDFEDPDVNLLPGIMDRIILPKITSFIQNVWSPASQNETFRLVNLMRNLHDNYPTINGKSKQLQNCLKAVSARMYKALDEDVFIPMYPRELLENRSLGASDFFQRQFWSAVKLLQNILSWDGLIAEQPLQQMSLGSLLNRYLLMGLHTSIMMKDTLDKCKTIVASFPKGWFKNLKGGSTLPLLKQFSSYLVKYADSYHSTSMKRGMATEEIKDMIKDIVQLLVTIESLNDAVCLAKKYSVSAFKN